LQHQQSQMRASPLKVAKPVARAIRMLLEYTRLAANVDNKSMEDLNLPGIELFRALVEEIQQNPQITSGVLIERRRGTNEGEYLARIIAKPLNLPEEGLHSEFQDTVIYLGNLRLEQRIDELTKKPFSLLSPAEKLELQQVLAARH
jgi:DNA primase